MILCNAAAGRGKLTNWPVGGTGKAGEGQAVADLALHLAILHGQVEPTWLVGVLAGVGADDAGPLGLTKMKKVSRRFTGMRRRNLGVTYGLLEEDIF